MLDDTIASLFNATRLCRRLISSPPVSGRAGSLHERDPTSRPKTEQERRWLEENRAAIEAYNRRVAQA